MIWNGSRYYVKFFEYTKKLSSHQKQHIEIIKESYSSEKQREYHA
eukprot:CAMPEP_0170503484 /NCGR_PEP_ID=MMETSP0208-20121228/44925_1 /TAXON_ID=197538 /ORGANISM="Strombidium inclinatum, Strain S3" /LENGTH=44 /DNA_ID= /DNA_START= /DNA_END= /DNA_ORIENTATION=